MNKTDRLLAIVLELQGRGRHRAEDLAATFETRKRRVYRDIEALCQSEKLREEKRFFRHAYDAKQACPSRFPLP